MTRRATLIRHTPSATELSISRIARFPSIREKGAIDAGPGRNAATLAL
jgi:hypothetical protein